MVHVKANFNGDIRRFLLPPTPKFADLVAQLSSLYTVSDFVIKYKDEEGDLVTLASDSELAEAVAATSDGLLRLDVLRSSPTQPATSSDTKATNEPRAAPVQAPDNTTPPATSQENNTPDDDVDMDGDAEGTMEGLASLFESMFIPMGSMFHGPRSGGFGRGLGWGPWHQRHSPFHTHFSIMHSAFRNVRPSTIEALETLKRELMTNCSLSAIMSAIPNAMPAVQTFLDGSVGQTGPVSQDAVDTLIATLAPAIAPHIGAPNAERVGAFVREALTDEGVLGVLRQVSSISARYSPAGGRADSGANLASSAAGRTASTAGRFDVHNGIVCDGCNSNPIVGTRHWCTTRPNFDLCDTCMANPGVDKTGMQFRAIEFPWLAEDGRRKVPRPTLMFGSRGLEVKMLQKILTDLGYMTPDMYRFGTGMYGPNTAQAVNKFREHYGLGTQGQYGMYDELVAASLLSVLESNVPPSAATGSGAGVSSSAAEGAGTGGTAAA